jgi:Xaa-Pro dipeptidase
MHSVLKRGGLYWDRELLPQAAYEKRLALIQAEIARSGDDAWLLFGDVERYGTVTFATNFIPRVRSALAFVPRSGTPVLLANIGLRDVPAAKTITWVDDIRPFGRLPKDLIALIEQQGLSAAKIGLCGFEESLPVADWTAIEAGLPKVRWSNRGALLWAMRASKESWEIEAIRRCAAMADEALKLAPEVLHAGVTMREAIAVIDRHIRRAGAEDAHYLVASGPQTAIGLRPVDDRALVAGDPIVISVAVESQRYWAEAARTFVLGKVSGELRALHAAAADALKAMRMATRAGATTRNIAAAAEKSLGDAKVSPASYGFGHGIGLDAEELPIIHTGGKESVARDATMALRVILPGKRCGVAVAQTVVAEADGCRPLNDAAPLIEL